MDGSGHEIKYHGVIFNFFHLFEGSMKKKFLETFIIDSNKALELKLGRPILTNIFHYFRIMTHMHLLQSVKLKMLKMTVQHFTRK